MASKDIELKLVLRATDQGLRGQVQAVNVDARTLNKTLDDTQRSAQRGAGGLDQVGRSAKSADGSMTALRATARSVGAVLAAVGAGRLAGEFVSVNMESQRLKASLTTVTGSVQAGNAAWAEMEAFARTTPFALSQSVEAFTKMKALGLDPTTSALTSFGNTAAAMGKDLSQMIEAVADASTGEFERLKEFGIKASQEGDRVKLTFQGVTTEIGNNASEITRYLEDIGNVQFAGAMARQMDTLGGAASNLGDNFDTLLRTIGEKGANDGLAEAINEVSRAIERLNGALKSDEFDAFLGKAGEFVAKYKLIVGEITNPGEDAGFVEGLLAKTPGGVLYKYLGFGGKEEFDSSVARIKSGLSEIETEARSLANGRTVEKYLKQYENLEVPVENLTRGFNAFAQATISSEAATKKNQNAIERLTSSLNDKVNALSKTEREVLELTLAENNATEGQKKLALSLFDTATAYQRAADAVDSYLAEEQARSQAVSETLGETRRTVDWLEREVTARMQGKEALVALNREMFIENGLRSESAKKLLPEQRAEYEQLLGTMYDLQQENEKIQAQADPAAQAWEEATKRIDTAFADAWMGAFDSFKDFAGSLKDAFKRLLAELAHMAITRPILISLGLGGSVGANAGALGGGGVSGALGGLGNLSSLMSLGKLASGVTTAGNFINAGLGKIGLSGTAWGLESAGYGIAEAFGFSSGVSSGMATTIGTLASAVAGYAGSWVGTKVGESLFGKQAESAWGATVGSIAGTIIGGPIGALIGGAIGGLVDGAFGGDGKKRAALGIRTAPGLGGTELASGLEISAYTKRAGSEGQQVASQMLAAFGAIDLGLTTLLDSLGVEVDLKGQALVGKAHQAGKSGGDFFGSAEFNKLVESDITGAADAFVKAWVTKVNELTGANLDLEPIFDLAAEGELLADTLIRVQSQFHGVNDTLAALGLSLYDTSVAGMVAADGLVQAMGGLDSFAQATSAYYAEYIGEAEKMASANAQLLSVFDGLNVEAPRTKDAFHALVQGLDLTTEAGQSAFATLMAVAPLYAQLATYQAQATDRITEMYREILGRDPDQEGLEHQVAAVMSGLSLDQIRDNIENSIEAQKLARIAAEREAVNAAYDGNMVDIEAARAATEGVYQVEMERLAGIKAGVDERYAAESAAIAQQRQAWQVLATDATSALGGLRRAVTEQQRALDSELAALVTPLQADIGRLQPTVDQLRTVSDMLARAIDGMRPAGSELGDYRRAQSRLGDMLASVSDGGSLNQDVLQTTLQSLGRDVSGSFGSRQDYLLDQARTAHLMADLKDAVGEQLTTEEGLLNAAQEQIDAAQAHHAEQTALLSDLVATAERQLDVALNGQPLSVDIASGLFDGALAALAAYAGPSPQALDQMQANIDQVYAAWTSQYDEQVGILKTTHQATLAAYDALAAQNTAWRDAQIAKLDEELALMRPVAETVSLISDALAESIAAQQASTADTIAAIGDSAAANVESVGAVVDMLGQEYQTLTDEALVLGELLGTNQQGNSLAAELIAAVHGIAELLGTANALTEAAIRLDGTYWGLGLRAQFESVDYLRGIGRAIGAEPGSVTDRREQQNAILTANRIPVQIADPNGKSMVQIMTEMAAEIRSLNGQVAELKIDQRAGDAAIAANTRKTADLLDRLSQGGDALAVVVEA